MNDKIAEVCRKTQKLREVADKLMKRSQGLIEQSISLERDIGEIQHGF
jgi:hypothetical protein